MADEFTLEELCLMRKDLQAALYSGASSVEFKDRQVKYQNVEQMQLALAQLNEQIACLQGVTPRTVINPTVTY